MNAHEYKRDRRIRLSRGSGSKHSGTRGGLLPSGPAAPSGVTLTYDSDGDTNGLFYYLGTSELTTAWSNPSSGGPVTATASSEFNSSYNPTRTTDRGDSGYPWHSAGEANPWIKWDLGSGYTVNPTDYTIQYRYDYGYLHPTTWILEGSNDNSTWTTIDTVVGDTQWAPTPHYGGWAEFSATATEAYRYLRLTMNSTNEGGGWHFAFAEIEFYGEVFATSPS